MWPPVVPVRVVEVPGSVPPGPVDVPPEDDAPEVGVPGVVGPGMVVPDEVGIVASSEAAEGFVGSTSPWLMSARSSAQAQARIRGRRTWRVGGMTNPKPGDQADPASRERTATGKMPVQRFARSTEGKGDHLGKCLAHRIMATP